MRIILYRLSSTLFCRKKVETDVGPMKVTTVKFYASSQLDVDNNKVGCWVTSLMLPIVKLNVEYRSWMLSLVSWMLTIVKFNVKSQVWFFADLQHHSIGVQLTKDLSSVSLIMSCTPKWPVLSLSNSPGIEWKPRIGIYFILRTRRVYIVVY